MKDLSLTLNKKLQKLYEYELFFILLLLKCDKIFLIFYKKSHPNKNTETLLLCSQLINKFAK